MENSRSPGSLRMQTSDAGSSRSGHALASRARGRIAVSE
jgi:hypothetical protein